MAYIPRRLRSQEIRRDGERSNSGPALAGRKARGGGYLDGDGMSKSNSVITIKINLSKILDKYVYEGKKGKWMDAVLVLSPNSEWNDYMVLQDLGEASRVPGFKRPIIGSGTIRNKKDENQS